MKEISIFLLALLFSVSTFAQTKFKADTEKSKIEWLGEKITGYHGGTINLTSGEAEIKDNTLSKAEFVIDMTSIKCTDLEDPDYNKKLVGHLNSKDFFDVATFPTAKITLVKPAAIQKGNTTINGNLTIKGITHPIEFKTVIQNNIDEVLIYANIVIDRTKYDIKYGSGSFFDSLGDKTIYDEFKIKVAVTLNK